MACSTATCAALASAIVCSFFSFACALSAVASAMAASSSLIAAVRSSMSCVSFAIVEVKSSFCAVKSSTASVFWSRVCLFAVSSVSHQPLCSISAVDSCMSFDMRSLIIRFTLTNGSAATCCAARASTLLSHDFARSAKNAATLDWSKDSIAWAPLRSCAIDVACTCIIWGKCFSPEPATLSLDNMSIACAMASSSSDLSFWRLSKSDDF
mmetsp:Transcript_17334/g.49266  ORF Transcript_17334/g.49266 Transcript_17334/m.49266 type:complete len:210 (+) Transcript_17334:559-1188(+)